MVNKLAAIIIAATVAFTSVACTPEAGKEIGSVAREAMPDLVNKYCKYQARVSGILALISILFPGAGAVLTAAQVSAILKAACGAGDVAKATKATAGSVRVYHIYQDNRGVTRSILLGTAR